MPPLPVVLALTLPPPAVTLVDMPPAEEVDDVAPPAVAPLLCTAHPPDELLDELLDELCANAGPARNAARAMPIVARIMRLDLSLRAPGRETCASAPVFRNRTKFHQLAVILCGTDAAPGGSCPT
jgi:hypothetical protein